MSADALPITPARFAAALKDLPLSSLRLKLLELRNSIAHLDYSNEQLRPYAEGAATALASSFSQSQPQSHPHTEQPQPQSGEPDQDCIEAIRENEEVIARMQERIRLVRAEAEGRGLSWAEFQAQGGSDNQDGREGEGGEEGEEGRKPEGEGQGMVNGEMVDRGITNGTTTTAAAAAAAEPGGGNAQPHSAWTDGTFQTGVIRDGVVHMNAVAGSGRAAGGSLSDEELRRRMEEQLRGLGGDGGEEDGEEGLHL